MKSQLNKVSYDTQNNESKIFLVSPDELLSKEEASSGLTVFDQNTVNFFKLFELGHKLILPAGEKHKQFVLVEKVLKEAVTLELKREGVMRAVGGGVLCDTVGLAASLYMRGCRLVMIPTTLLAMVDASVGGKTGVDFSGFKNLIGTFYPAEEIRICSEYLLTLPAIEFKSGIAEIIKHALLKPDNLLPLLRNKKQAIESRDLKVMNDLIRFSIEVKKEIVEQDLTEKGVRAFLNLGHTFAHALESVSGFNRYSHGQAVAWGIAKAMDAGVLIGLTNKAYRDEVVDLLKSYGFNLNSCDYKSENLIEAIRMDKKDQKAGSLRFVLQKNWGETFREPLPENVLREVLG